MGKPSSIKVLQAYRPIWPSHAHDVPSFQPPPLPKLVPFFKDKRHTIPTKWRLYRDLMRATCIRQIPPATQTVDAVDADVTSCNAQAATSSALPPQNSLRRPRRLAGQDGWPHIRRWIREKWRKERPVMIIKRTYGFLVGQYNLLSVLKSNDPITIKSLYESEEEYKIIHAEADERDRQAKIEAAKPPPKPRVVGGYVYPTPFFVPMPRLKPQPPHISGIIRKRLRQKERNVRASQVLRQLDQDMRYERTFLRNLGVSPEISDWGKDMPELMGYFWEAQKAGEDRRDMLFSERDVRRVEKAKKEKLQRRFKRMQREREAAINLGSNKQEDDTTVRPDVMDDSDEKREAGEGVPIYPVGSIIAGSPSAAQVREERVLLDNSSDHPHRDMDNPTLSKAPTKSIRMKKAYSGQNDVDEGKSGLPDPATKAHSGLRGRPRKADKAVENEKPSENATFSISADGGEPPVKKRGRPRKSTQ